MPVYEYICLDCGLVFDQLRSMKEADSPIVCANCNSQHTSRKVSVFFASSGGKTIAGGGSSCSTCSSSSCATCKH